ncbi:MAG: hypothetical protein AAGA34_05575 [Pseudomonadota bacterium]
MPFRTVCLAAALAWLAALVPAPSLAQEQNPEAVELDRLLAESLARKAALARERRLARERKEAAELDGEADESLPSSVTDVSVADLVASAVEEGDEDAEPWTYTFGPEVIEDFLSMSAPYGIDDLPRLEAFDRAIRRALRTEPTLEAASQAAAHLTALEGEALPTFVRLWIETEAMEYLFRADGMTAEQQRWRDEFVAFALNHGDAAPLALEAAALIFDDKDECAREDAIVLRLMEGRSAAIAWRVARANRCREAIAAFATTHPDHALGALIEMEHYGWLELAGKLPVSAWLVRADTLARVAADDRAAVSAVLDRRRLRSLLRADFPKLAVLFAEGLPDEALARALEPDARDFFATIDGLPVHISGDKRADRLKGSLATAYYLTGREEQARALINADGALSQQRAWLECVQSDREPEEKQETCPRTFREEAWALLLGHQLDTPEADPYPLAELFYGRSASFVSRQMGGAELTCRVFAHERFGDVCKTARAGVGYALTRHTTDYDRSDHEAVMATLRGLGLPGFETLDRTYAALVEAKLNEIGRPEPRSFQPASIDPVYPDYGERALPDALAPYDPSDEDRYASYDPPEWPDGWSDPEPGFWPVRWEQKGERAAFVSLSPFYNPSGEISQGGYWVHLSDDGGRSWQTPMFTGLAQFWPYLVAPQSQLPMLTETGLQLEVTIAELDTASITYPPIGLSTRREATGRVIDLPFARLKADSDGDGLSDVAEAHLLLDREGEARPYILGTGDASACPVTPSRADLARVALLNALFDTESRAIIEPVNRAARGIDFGGWTGKSNALVPPLFLRADPDDFACIETARPVLIYSDAQVEKLQRRSPDFRTVELPTGVWNEDRTRGYVVWSAGWTGGTFLLKWTGETWDIIVISNWIT